VSTLRPQFINLFQKDRSWKTRVLKANGIAAALAVLTAGLAALTWYSTWRLRAVETETGAVAQEYEHRNAGLTAAGATYSTRDDYQRLQRRVKDLEQTIARQDVVLGRMQTSTLQPRDAFSVRLEAVARARIEGVWLTQLEIATTPAKIRLAGVAMSADLLPQYLLQLGGEPRLGIRKLNNLTVDRAVQDERAAAAGAVGFDLLQLETEVRGVL
jgi:hypothetical protein